MSRTSLFIEGASPIDAAPMLRSLVQSGAGDVRAGPFGLLAIFDTPSSALVAAMRLRTEFGSATDGLGIGIDADDAAGQSARSLARLARGGGALLSPIVASAVTAPRRWLMVARSSQGAVAGTSEVVFELTPARARVPTNLPRPRTSFVGREEDLAAMTHALDNHFVLAITGAPGVGKTRFAQELGEDLLGSFPDGIYWIPLTGVNGERRLLRRIAATLGVAHLDRQRLRGSVVQHLAGKRVLLLLDHADHALPSAALVEELLSASPLGRLLVTSRIALSLDAAREHQLGPLPVPCHGEPQSSADELRRLPSTRLFAERAAATRSRFEIDHRNAETVAEICRRLDGLPLAIELAAARLRHLTTPVLLAELERRVTVPPGDATQAGEYHRSLETAVESSYAQLTPTAQRVFRCLSAFRGGFTRSAAVAVCTDRDPAAGEVPALMEALVDHSLVQPPRDDDVQLRYSILEPLRQFGADRLAEAGEDQATHERHAVYFATLAELPGPVATAASRKKASRLAQEEDNLRSALDWAIRNGQPTTAASIALGTLPLWVHTGNLGEGRRWVEATEAVAASLPAERRAETWLIRGLLAQWQGDWREAALSHKQAVEAATASGSAALLASTLATLSQAAVQATEDEKQHAELAAHAAAESIAISERLDDAIMRATALLSAALVAMRREATAEAEDKLMAAESLCGATTDPRGAWFRAIVLKFIGMVLLYRKHDVPGASAAWRESLMVFRQHNTTWAAAWVLDDLAAVAEREGNEVRSARLAGAAARHASSYGTSLRPFARWATRVNQAAATTPYRARSDAWDEGQRMSLAEAISYALAEDAAQPGTHAGLEVSALGPVRVVGRGGPVTRWGGKKAGSRQAQAIFAFLFDRADQGVAKDEFLELLWPDTDLTRADVALHRTLMGLRTTLAAATGLPRAEVIPFEGDRYRLAANVVQHSDVADFLTASTQAALTTDDHAALRSGEMARTLVRGDLLEDCPFYGDSAYVEEHRDMVRERFCDLLHMLGEIYEARGQMDLARERYRFAFRASGGTDRRALEGLARLSVAARR